MIYLGYSHNLITQLDEKTIPSLLAKAKRDDKSRYAKRTDSGDNWSIYRIGVLELLNSDDLYIYFKVKDYKVSLRIVGFKPTLEYMNDNYKYPTVESAVKATIDYCYKHNDVEVSCTCPDFKYRFAYMASAQDYILGNPEVRPAKLRNPKNKVGICKHIIKVLNAPSKWVKPVATVLKNYLKNGNRK
jgi:hypothetical protein